MFFSLLRRMAQKGCGIFSVAQMDYVTAGRDGGVASGGFAASASGHPMEVKRRGWTAVWIGRSCNPSYRATVCRIFATLRGIVKRLFPWLSPGVSARIPADGLLHPASGLRCALHLCAHGPSTADQWLGLDQNRWL